MDRPNESNRVTRALPPRYLSVEGFKSCLVNYSEETSTHWCFPLKKLTGCPTKAWNELGKAMKSSGLLNRKMTKSKSANFSVVKIKIDCVCVFSFLLI